MSRLPSTSEAPPRFSLSRFEAMGWFVFLVPHGLPITGTLLAQPVGSWLYGLNVLGSWDILWFLGFFHLVIAAVQAGLLLAYPATFRVDASANRLQVGKRVLALSSVSLPRLVRLPPTEELPEREAIQAFVDGRLELLYGGEEQGVPDETRARMGEFASHLNDAIRWQQTSPQRGTRGGDPYRGSA